MSYVVDLKVDRVKAEAIKKELTRLPKHIMNAGRETTRIISNRFAGEIRMKYMGGSGEHESLTEATMEKRRFGKKAGKGGRRIPPFPGSTPLKRSGTLSKLVEIKKITRGKTTTHKVRLRPGMALPYSPGSISGLAGMVHEFGEIHTLTVTPKMRRYLFALLQQAGRKDEMSGPNWGKKRLASFGGALQIIIRIPPRPVWMPAIQCMIVRQPKEFARLFRKQLQKRTKFRITGRVP